MNTATQQIADKLTAAGYVVSEWTDNRGDQHVTAHNGQLVASAALETDGRIHASMVIDYGKDGTSWCDSATMKSVAGIVRRVSGFLGTVAA